jgi:predicted RNase H-related nuclease YkuK (DUF458 family)
MEEIDLDKKIWIYADQQIKIKSPQFIEWVKKKWTQNPDYESNLIVGTDSQGVGKVYKFTTVVCIYKKGYGGDYFYYVSYEDKKLYRNQQALRIQREVEKSIEVADWLLDKTEIVSEIHIDASPKEKNEFTSAFSDQLKGYAIGSGYVAKIKPESFVATSVSDKHLR